MQKRAKKCTEKSVMHVQSCCFAYKTYCFFLRSRCGPRRGILYKVPNKELHLRSDTARIYVSRKKGGGGLISCEACVFGEENSLSWYVRNSEKVLLGKVGEKRTVKVDEAKYPKEPVSEE